MSTFSKIQDTLGDKAEYFLGHESKTISKADIATPNGDFVSEHFAGSNRSNQVMNNLARLYNHGRLGGTGYVSILPVDQGIEHSAAASFAPNPRYFDPQNIVELAIESGCNGVASTYGVLAQCSRKYAHKIPFIVKINHNELLTYPSTFNQIMFGSVESAWEMGAAAVLSSCCRKINDLVLNLCLSIQLEFRLKASFYPNINISTPLFYQNVKA